MELDRERSVEEKYIVFKVVIDIFEASMKSSRTFLKALTSTWCHKQIGCGIRVQHSGEGLVLGAFVMQWNL